MVKKTVNFDAPEAYHLYFGDEQGSPGSILTWFEFAGAQPRPRRRGHDPHDPARRAPARRRSTSGTERLGEHGLLERALGRARCSSPTTTGSRLELVVADRGQPAAAGRASRDPGRARDHSASRARAPTSAAPVEADARTADRDARLHRSRRDRRATASTARPRTFHWTYDRDRRARDPGRRHRPSHRLAFEPTTTTCRGSSASPPPGCT